LKKKVKKISLNRETLRTLDNQLDAVAGGVTTICGTKNPTACAPLSGCYTCDACEPPGTRTCVP
jgi:hypothetical protein